MLHLRLLLTLLTLLCCLSVTAPLFAAEPVEVVIEGVEEDALDNVKAALALPSGLIRDDKVDELWLERFAGQAEQNVRTALEPYGYYSARIHTALTSRGPGQYKLTVSVDLDRPLRIERISVSLTGPGADEEELRALVQEFPLHKDDILLQQEYEDAKGVLKAKALELGYLDETFTRHEIRIAPDRVSATVELSLETGPRYLFGTTTITGAAEYPGRFLHRYLSFDPGDRFSYAALGETQRNYMNSDRFAKVIISPEKENAENLQVPVTVQLTPVARRRLRPGIGYGTDTGARGTLSYRDLNMFHLGHELNTQFYLAERLQGISAGYIMPGYRDINSSTGLRLTLQREESSTYISRLVSLEANRTWSFGAKRLGTAYVKLQQESFTIGGQDSDSRLVLPGFRFSERNYDDLVRPTRGYRYGLEVRGAHPYLGSDSGLIQFLVDGNVIVPLPWRFSLVARGNGGISVLDNPLGDLPASLRLYAGGDRSVRGYAYQSLGPRDSSDRVVGGRHLLVGSLELERALFRNWGVSLFYDAGNASNSLTDLHLRQGAGVGLHYYTVVGGINLYLARQVGVNDPNYRIHLTIGFEL